MFFSHMGLANALERKGYEVNSCLIMHWRKMQELFLSVDRYDLVIINDLVHGVGKHSGQLNHEHLIKLKTKTDLIIALVGESVYGYREVDGNTPEWVPQRINNFKESVSLIDGFWLVDPDDHHTDLFKGMKVFPLVPFLSQDIKSYTPEKESAKRNYIFVGTINNHRSKALGKISHAKFVLGKLETEDEQFWDPCVNLMKSMIEAEPPTLESYSADLRLLTSIRKDAELHFQAYIANFKGLVHLPTYWKGFHPRFLQAVMSGIIPIMPDIDSRFAYGLKKYIHYYPFDPSKPESLEGALNVLEDDPEMGRQIVNEAKVIASQTFSEDCRLSKFLDQVAIL